MIEIEALFSGNMLIFQKVLLAIAIGGLVGIERERMIKRGKFAGVRTFMLVCLFGLLSGHVSGIVKNHMPIYIGLGGVSMFAIMSYYARYLKSKKIGMTTELAFILTFFIGVLLFFETAPYFMSISLGIVLMLILVSSHQLHGFAKGLTERELRDAAIFAALVFIVYLLIPDAPVDPWGALNLRTVWFSVVIVLSVSFASYVAMKVLGTNKGLNITGILGGLTSSTAVALNMAARSKRNRRILYSAAFATIVASSTMFIRQLIIASIFNAYVGLIMLPAFLILGVIGYIFSYFLYEKVRGREAAIKIQSPLEFGPVVKFAVFFTIVIFSVNMIEEFVSPHIPYAIYIVALLSGILDVDAITISIASLGLPLQNTLVAVLLAAISNTVTKWYIVKWLGSKEMGREVGKIFLIILIVAVFVIFLNVYGPNLISLLGF